MFLIGDRVVHPMHGAGIIENIIEERLAGKLGRYYVFRMPVGGLVLKIPTDNCGSIGVRALSTAAQIEEIFHKIPSLPVEINSNWNRRYRENMERITRGQLHEVAPTASAKCSTAPSRSSCPRSCSWSRRPIRRRKNASTGRCCLRSKYGETAG